jgi:hypothetical protein
MLRDLSPAVLVVAAILSGCSSPGVDLPPSPPHGGTAFALPDGKGFVEVVRQDAAGQPGFTQLFVYFLDAERNTRPSASITASFKPRDRGAEPVTLKPIGDADPAQVGGFTSAPFRDPGEIVGLLSATFASQPLSVAVNLR